MPAAELVLEAPWVLPVAPDNCVLRDHAVVIGGGRILDLLPQSAARVRYAAVDRRALPGHALLPGFVNAHTHAAMTLLRGYADDLPLEPWLRDHVWPAESRWLSPDFVGSGTALAAAEMLLGGTTCFGDMYFFPDATAAAAAEAGIRAVIGMAMVDFATAWADGPDEYFRKGLAVRDSYRGHPRVRFAFAPHAPYTVSDATLAQVRVLADELELPVFMHVHETAAEVADSIRDHARRPLRRLDDLGLLGPQFAAIHLTQLEPHEIELLARRNAHAIHCPESNLKLASGQCPVARLRAAGVNVGLGTDGPASNNDLDMFGELRTAALLAKGVAGDAAALPAPAALRMATLDGARALGLADEIGSLEPGKAADLIAVDLARPATQPVHNALSQVVYAAGRDQVTAVWVAGEPRVAAGQPVGADLGAIIARAAEWQARIGSDHEQ
jgi:5-methylthioadenosine/S-adenosylhomocysteine deaminase